VGLIEAITATNDRRSLDDCDEWCAGLPLTGTRLLESDELTLLRGRVNSQFSRQKFTSIGLTFVFAGVYITSILFPSPHIFWLTVAGAYLMAVFVIWLLLDPESWLRKYKVLQADLDAGIVHCFGTASDTGVLEVLPTSEIVYSSNAVSPKGGRRAAITAVAKTPAIASIAVEWLEPVNGGTGRFFSGKRELSRAERSEIRRWTEAIFDHRRRHAVSYVCWAAFIGGLSRWGNPDLFYAALAVSGYVGSQMCTEIRLVMALKRDALGGIVVINRRAKVEDGKMTPIGSPAEFLPQAQLKWTDSGAPADWRKLT
jgi:hypothetical protein